MQDNQELFLYIKKQEWDSFEKKININIDFNIKDELNNYLIHYIILYNNLKILTKILTFDIKLDWLDNEGRSILYIPIKFNYIDIIKILLEYETNKIGLSIMNIKDVQNFFPLHYALFFKNLEIFNILIPLSNLYIFDKNKNSLIHMIVKTKNINFLTNILLQFNNFNITNDNNETALHIACVYDLNNFIEIFINLQVDINIKEKLGGLTPAMICIYNGNNIGFNLILQSKININDQNFDGNSYLHIAIIENNFDIINKIITSNYDIPLSLDVFNIDGNLPLHIILYKILSNEINQENYNLEYFIQNTNLNIQNNECQTCWHFLVLTNLFKKYINILINKKNNIFLVDNNNQSPYDLVKIQDKNELINIIVQSYLNYLKKYQNWVSEWDIICSRPDTDDKLCFKQIKEYILENKISLPLKKKYICIDIDQQLTTNTSTFTGINLDLITCYIELIRRNKNLITSITSNFVGNNEVESYYKKLGIIKELSGDYLNYQIYWIFQKMIIPSNLDQVIKNYIKSNKQIMAIPIAIDLENGSHSNVIIIDKHFKTIERFEPHGAEEPRDFNYNKIFLDFMIKTYLEKYFPDYKYLEPKDFLPIISFQSLEVAESKLTKKIGDPKGFCAGWCLWYLEQRLKYLVDPLKLARKLIIKIKSKNISFKNLIRSYIDGLLKFRNEILDKLNIDINNIINENIKQDQSLQIEKNIRDTILEYL